MSKGDGVENEAGDAHGRICRGASAPPSSDPATPLAEAPRHPLHQDTLHRRPTTVISGDNGEVSMAPKGNAG
jgi:hypothetical protein